MSNLRPEGFNYFNQLLSHLGWDTNKIFNGDLIYPRQIDIHLPGDGVKCCNFDCLWCQGKLLDKPLGNYENDLLRDFYKEAPVNWGTCFGFIETNTVTAELIKFVSNLLGTCKVSLANEIYDVCQVVDADFDAIRRATYLDSRLGSGFFNVTTKRGWGGRCFPKDMEIFLHPLKEKNMESLVLEATRNANLKYRKLGDES